MTAFYMFRLYALTFLGKFRGTHEQEHHLHESPPAITIPLIVLAILSVIGGFVGIPEVFATNAHILEHFLSPIFTQSKALQEEHAINHSTELILMAVVTVLVVAVIIFAWTKFSRYERRAEEAQGLSRVLENKWYVDELYNTVVVSPLDSIAGFSKNVVEKSGIDGIVNGVGRFIQYSARQLRLLQSGLVGNYILFMVLSIVVLFLVFWNQAIILSFFQKLF
jgi:NADH-quinone oxidoreductase subunit L